MGRGRKLPGEINQKFLEKEKRKEKTYKLRALTHGTTLKDKKEGTELTPRSSKSPAENGFLCFLG